MRQPQPKFRVASVQAIEVSFPIFLYPDIVIANFT